MTEPEPTGYGDSPDTTDAADAADTGGGEPGNDGPPLTTDDEAQRDDLPVRPGNEPD
jgi:hypothetical protein